jgi:hypothetical protein
MVSQMRRLQQTKSTQQSKHQAMRQASQACLAYAAHHTQQLYYIRLTSHLYQGTMGMKSGCGAGPSLFAAAAPVTTPDGRLCCLLLRGSPFSRCC